VISGTTPDLQRFQCLLTPLHPANPRTYWTFTTYRRMCIYARVCARAQAGCRKHQNHCKSRKSSKYGGLRAAWRRKCRKWAVSGPAISTTSWWSSSAGSIHHELVVIQEARSTTSWWSSCRLDPPRAGGHPGGSTHCGSFHTHRQCGLFVPRQKASGSVWEKLTDWLTRG
jgi:hypothetical protein